jgi:hypothetical protein
MIWPKKASEHKDHISIVRANKREVNDAFGCKGYHNLEDRGLYRKNSLIGCKIFWVMMLNVELNYLEWCIPYEDMTSPERLDWTNPL